MSRHAGRLVRVDLGAGGWALETDDGRYTLVGDVPEALEGRQVVVHGQPTEGAGFLMTGDPLLEVRKVVAAEG